MLTLKDDQKGEKTPTAMQDGGINADSQTIKPIETEFTAEKGFRFTQIAREGDIAIYRRVRIESEDFEVIRIRESKGGVRSFEEDGVTTTIVYNPKELYPSNEQWGELGWTYTTEADARAKMNSLIKEVTK